jgi:pyridoxamine 5'-phosphate oxidase
MAAIKAQPDPLPLFTQWFEKAARALGLEDASAMCLATADAEGHPSARIVLLKSFDARGFVFYTNQRSRKGKELAANPYAALCLYWTPLDRQVRIEGKVMPATAKEADRYFASRHPDSRRGAWASLQSRPLESREELMERFGAMKKKYPDETAIPRPPHWVGYRLVPKSIEFWEEGKSRLHTRLRYTKGPKGWKHGLIYP